MNTEDFVTYEQALALKKLGFREKCYQYYDTSGIIQDNDFICNEVFQTVISSQLRGSHNSGVLKETCDAPTLAQAQKWLRKNKNVSIEPRYDALQWWCSITDILTSDWKDLPDTYKSYERALSEGITEYLKFLEK